MSDVYGEDVEPTRPPPADEAGPGPDWQAMQDTAVIEMRPWDGLESLAGIGQSPSARMRSEAAWGGVLATPTAGDYIARFANDDKRLDWWFIPRTVAETRYTAAT